MFNAYVLFGIGYSYDTTARTGTGFTTVGKTVNSVPLNGKLFAFSAGSGTNKLQKLESENGISWIGEYVSVPGSPTEVAALRTLYDRGILCCAGHWYNGSTYKPLTVTSLDYGETHTVTIIESASGKRFLDMAAGLGVFVAVGQPNTIQWSTDGITWNDVTPAGGTPDYITVTFDGTLFHAYSATTKHHAYSADGKTWTLTTFTTTATAIDAVIYGAAQRQYSLYSIGYNALQNYKMVELINGDLLPTARPKIGVDCNVGDVVDIVDKERGIIVSKILTEAQTVYERDKNGIIYPNFGDGYLDLKKYIKKEVEKRG